MKQYRRWSGSDSRTFVERILATTAVIVLFLATPAQATVKNLGAVGRTYPVVEPDGLAGIAPSRLQMEQVQQKIAERIKNYQPADTHPLPRASADRTFMVDMTYRLDRDLTNAENKVVYPKGYTFNPLDYITLPGGLIIIDGDDPSQVRWFRTSPYNKNHQARLLLASGQAAELTEKLQRPVFYLTDEIAERLHLAAAPSVVIQKGDKIQVLEFFIPDTTQGIPDEDS